MTATPMKIKSLGEKYYEKYQFHYSKKNWYFNEPEWSVLTDDDKKFWNDMVAQIYDNGAKSRSVPMLIEPIYKSPN